MGDLTLMGESPFDAIRRTREDGSEYWSARDLMPLLGYDRYENFVQSINRARAAAGNTEGEDRTQHHFRDARKMVSIGSGAQRDVGDRHLSRFAAYLVAMNGDPRKPEIAAAQTYFAVRTREAETRPAARELSRRELAEYWARAEAELEEQRSKVAELAAPAHSWNQLADASGDYSLREAAQILDRDPSIRTGQNRLSKHLKNIGWTDRSGQPYQRHVDAGRLTRRTVPYLNRATGEEELTTQLRITAKGLADLHREMGGTGPLMTVVAS